MKISIDTQHDSPEEIRKVIRMLQHLVGEHAVSNVSDDMPQPSEGLFSMFGDNSEPASDSSGSSESSDLIDTPSESSVIESDDDPEIELY